MAPEQGEQPPALPPVGPAKVLPPRWHDGLLRRDRLVKVLEESCSTQRLTVVCAPAGYGKTTLLADFASRAKQPVMWLRLDEEDRDESRVLASLAAAVEMRFPVDAARDGVHLLSPGAVHDQRGSLARLARHITRSPVDCVLVFDSVETISGSDGARRILQEFLKLIPDYVHVMVGTRTLDADAFAGVYRIEDVTRIGSEALHFKAEEVEACLAQIGTPVAEWQPILANMRRYEGWPAAVTLLLRSGRVRGLPGVSSGLDPQVMFNLLAAEMITRLPAESATFLRQIANLERITPALCADCLGVINAGTRLSRLVEQNLFVEELAGGAEYRLHGLFREFLLQEASSLFTPDQHRLAAAWFEHESDSVSAIRHLIGAGELALAAEKIDTTASRLSSSGRVHTILQLVEQ
jgi:LuxR family transcriptional regulator, maltose regulon positive regulatory protein